MTIGVRSMRRKGGGGGGGRRGGGGGRGEGGAYAYLPCVPEVINIHSG